MYIYTYIYIYIYIYKGPADAARRRTLCAITNVTSSTRRPTWFFNASSYVVFQRVVLRGFLYLFIRKSLGIGGFYVI